MQLRGRCYSCIGILFFTLWALPCLPINAATRHAETPQLKSYQDLLQRLPLHPEVNPSIADKAGYITPAAHFLGTIFHSQEEPENLSPGNHVVIDVGTDQQLQVGDQFTIWRPTATVQHPVSAQHIGTLVAPQGTATAVHVQASTAILRISQSFNEIEVGDRVQKISSSRSRAISVEFVPVEREIGGVIIASQDSKVSSAEEDIVYIDKGEQEGVQIGDQFKVYREGDTVQHPTSHLPVHLPRNAIGELSILDVQDHTATAAVTYSQRELSVGAPVELHAALRVIKPKLDILAQLPPCLEASRAAIQAAQEAGATAAELEPAISALDSAQQRFEQAKAALDRGDTKQANHLLVLAQQDCLSAQELGEQARLVAEQRGKQTGHYTVQRGDTLWGISDQKAIYNNALMWPLIYKANQNQIQDPDLIFPKQIFTIPRNYSSEEADTAIQRARKRRSWRLGDGPDLYILEGVRK
jgi:LysM repeat protein